MNENLEKVKSILHEYDQEHLLFFYDELSDDQKEMLLDQILKIDFKQIMTLYNDSFADNNLDMSTVSPIE